MRRKVWIMFFIILAVAILAGIVDWPKGPDLKIGSYFQELKIHQGLDLLGGSQLVYEADMSKIAPQNRDSALEGIQTVIDRRINALGVSEPVIQTTSSMNSYRVLIELPGITNIDEAINMIGQTAQLEFREGIVGKSIDSSGQLSSVNIDDWNDIGLNGSLFTKATAQINQSSYEPEVSITFNDAGAKIFSDVTARNIGKPLAIFLDKTLLSAPRVNQAIDGGNAVITGQFTVDQTKKLAIQLNAGALPVPINLVQQSNVGATLGQDSVHKSFVAGLIGILFVILFMMIRYRFPGFISAIALFVYALIVMALFKLIPVTMTLAGIAGFILSVGMAVDANILIFERTNEELRRGKVYSAAIKAGFNRAWTSIRDSNASSLITCAILFFLGTGTVKGFALTLAVGILVSLFTAITVTRNLLFLFLGNKVRK